MREIDDIEQLTMEGLTRMAKHPVSDPRLADMFDQSVIAMSAMSKVFTYGRAAGVDDEIMDDMLKLISCWRLTCLAVMMDLGIEEGVE